MIHNQNVKVVASTPIAAVGATATATLTIDRLGYDQVSVLAMRAGNASTVFASVLKVEESDSVASNYSDVTALVGGGVGGFTIPAASGDTNVTSVVKMDVDCLARKRYLRVSMTPGVTASVGIVASLSRAEESPTTAAEAGVVGWIKG